MADKKYEVDIHIVVNAADREEAVKEAGYQIYYTTYDTNTTVIAINEIESEE